MALQKKSKLEKLLITFEEGGKFAAAEALFEEGAWDTDAQDWVGEPKSVEYSMHTSLKDGAKMLNDVLGVANTKAIARVSELQEIVAEQAAKITSLQKSLEAANYATDLAGAKLDREAQSADRWKEVAAGNAAQAAQWKGFHASRDEEVKKLKSLPSRLTFGLWR